MEKNEGISAYLIVINDENLHAYKPAGWLEVFHRYYGGSEIGIEALTNCHNATIWSKYGSWTPLFTNRHHCPNTPGNTGAIVSPPGSITDFLVDFDGTQPNLYKLWQDGVPVLICHRMTVPHCLAVGGFLE